MLNYKKIIHSKDEYSRNVNVTLNIQSYKEKSNQNDDVHDKFRTTLI
jgi:hypothetical protein